MRPAVWGERDKKRETKSGSDLGGAGRQCFVSFGATNLALTVKFTGSAPTMGKATKSEMQMDIPLIVCGRYGNELSGLIMTDVSCNQSNNFNLFSLTCATQDGWEMH